jgi:hypothetical protein
LQKIEKGMAFHQDLFKNYDNYYDRRIQWRQFKATDLHPILLELKNNPMFKVAEAGKSFQGRLIYEIKVGSGPTTVLMWSQMHGDEPTATMALLDVFRFLTNPGKLQNERNQILQNLTLVFLPMLNPDGAEVFQRRNAQDIDVNRDALRLTTPEGKLLKSTRDKYNADFGFNLHDQSFYYAAGENPQPATISFLAPAYNYEREFNPVRSRAMQLIVKLNQQLQEFIPEKIARYDDAFEPRAFGDNIQKWGTSAILVESGGYPGDFEKQFIRKINFILLLSALESISTDDLGNGQLADYEAIPENKTRFFDLLLRNVQLVTPYGSYRTDLGLVRNHLDPVTPEKTLFKAVIDDVGDLSTRFGYQELDASDLQASPGKVTEESYSWNDLQDLDFGQLLRKGYTYLRLKEQPAEGTPNPYPINLAGPDFEPPEIELNAAGNLQLLGNGKLKYVVMNGFLHDPAQNPQAIGNAVIY